MYTKRERPAMLERYLECAIACSREIDAPAEAVWSVMSNVASFDKVLSGVSRVERLDRYQNERSTSRPTTTVNNNEEKIEEHPQEEEHSDEDGGEGKIRVGMKYRIYRELRDGERYFADWVVTHVIDSDDDEEEESISWREERTAYSVTFYSTNVAGGITASSTWSIRSAGERSIANISIAIVPTRLCYMMGRIVCSCLLQRKAIKLTEIDLEDIAIAAELIASEGDNIA